MTPEQQRIVIAEAARFGRLTLVSRAPTKSARNKRWLCVCDCGNEKEVGQGELTSGKTKSCGCLRRELTALNKTKHGNAKSGSTSKEYRIWSGMNRRCHLETHPAFADYGARGIWVCEEWRHDFPRFLSDMGRCPPGKSIDRIRNDLGYFKVNCRWATAKEQSNNRRARRWKKKP